DPARDGADQSFAHGGRGEAREFDRGRRLHDRPIPARGARPRRARQDDRISRQGAGYVRYRRCPDVHGAAAADAPPPDHEPAGISVGIGGKMSRTRFSFSQASRRELLRAAMYGVSVSAGAALPVPVFGQAAARLASRGQAEGKILVILELSGGNDGLNTLVSYGDDAY